MLEAFQAELVPGSEVQDELGDKILTLFIRYPYRSIKNHAILAHPTCLIDKISNVETACAKGHCFKFPSVHHTDKIIKSISPRVGSSTSPLISDSSSRSSFRDRGCG